MMIIVSVQLKLIWDWEDVPGWLMALRFYLLSSSSTKFEPFFGKIYISPDFIY